MLFKHVWLLSFLCCVLAGPMEDPKLFEGDMILEPDQAWRIENGGDVNPNIPLAATKSNLWPLKIPYTYSAEIGNSSYAVGKIQDAIADYHKHTCLNFVRRTTEKEYLNFFKGGGCSSHVGHYKYRVNHISLARGCWSKGIIMHEIAHSLGFYHEQSRPDRDHYVKILWENIPDHIEYNFRKHGSNIDSMNVPYDYLSVMHYGRTAFGSGKMTIQTLDPSKQYLIGQRGGFSNLDILQMNLLYKCPGFTKPPPGTHPPLPTTQPATKPITNPNTKSFIIRHFGGLCLAVRSDGLLHLTAACNDEFSLTSSWALQHKKTKKCVIPDSSSFLKLTSDCQTAKARFQQTSASSIRHLSTNKCVHPRGGSLRPALKTKVVIHSGCNENRLSFKFEYGAVTTIAPSITTTQPPVGSFIIKHYSGLCVAVNANNRLYLTSACGEKFQLTSTNSLKHVSTGKCALPERLNDNSFITLQSDCTAVNTQFKQTSAFSVQHVPTGKCIHPQGGSLRPSVGTRVVIYRSCDQNRLQFKFVYGI